MKVSLNLSMLILLFWVNVSVAQDILVHSLKSEPIIDGSDQEWREIEPFRVTLKKSKPDGTVMLDELELKVGRYQDRVYFYVEWQDTSKDIVHKPWVWDDAKNKYVRGPQREDRLALQFAMSEDYTTNWFSGNEFSADTWHWKSSRSNPLALAHDKSLKITRHKQLRAARLKLPNGDLVYITRPSDSGDKLYKTKRYRNYQKPLMEKYQLLSDPSGSIADVKAKGIWKAGKWHLEMTRLLTTGQEDDVILPKSGGSIAGGLAVFNHSENDDHAISDTLSFHFPSNDKTQ